MMYRELKEMKPDSPVFPYLRKMKQNHIQKSILVDDVRYFGSEKSPNRRYMEQLDIEITQYKAYKKIFKGNFIFKSNDNVRSNNTYAMMKNGEIIKIREFLVSIDHEKQLKVCNKITVEQDRICRHIYKVVNVQDDVVCVETKDIRQSGVYMKVGLYKYISVIINNKNF